MKAHEILEEAADIRTRSTTDCRVLTPGITYWDISDELAAMMRDLANYVTPVEFVTMVSETYRNLLSIAEKITGKKAEHS